MYEFRSTAWTSAWVALASLTCVVSAAPAQAAAAYRIYVSNERSGDVTVIDGSSLKVVSTITAGKRPRGIHVSPDGKTVYVALSGTPIEGPPPLDAQGNPILKKNTKSDDDDDDDDAKSDKSADGIGVIDLAQGKLTGKIPAGSDPEEFALSHDGTHIYVSNEDIKTSSVINIASGKVEHIIPVGREPEGVGVTPDGKQYYVTCETGGDVFVIDTTTYKVRGQFTVPVRPRSVDFLSNAAIGFIPSESKGLLNVIDTKAIKYLQPIALPPGSRPMKVKVSTDNSKVFVSDGRAGTVSVIDTKSYALLATIKVGARPWGVALSPDGKYLFTANGPSNDVSVVDLATNKEVSRIKAGEGPWGIAIGPAR